MVIVMHWLLLTLEHDTYFEECYIDSRIYVALGEEIMEGRKFFLPAASYVIRAIFITSS